MILKGSMNALHNVSNPHQGTEKRVLCVCSAGLLRSATAANVLYDKYKYNTRNAGIADYALIAVSEALLAWADEVVCVEKEVFDRLQSAINDFEQRYGRIKTGTFIVLDIPDIYARMDAELQQLIIEQYEEAINEN